MKIIIAGAGIGGLSAALCLSRVGHDVVLLEQAAELSEVGAGLQCGANAMQVLNYLGLNSALHEYAVAPEAVQFLDYKTGAVLHRIELGQVYQQRYGAEYLHVHRADLQKVLLQAVEQDGNIELHTNTKITHFEEHSDQVLVSAADGQVQSGELLVAADGIHSSIRSQLADPAPPSYSGMMAWRITVPASKLPEGWMPKVVSNFVGPNKHCVIYYVRNQELVNLVGVVESPQKSQELDDSWVSKAPKADLLSDYEGWHPIVTQLIEAVEQQDCYRWALHAHQSLGIWSSKRVTLLGDAAHATLPFMASGAAMAIEDARILERSLTKHADLAHALECYQANRIPRTQRIQADSARMGQVYHLPSQFLRRAVFKGIQKFGSSRQHQLAAYNANQVELA